MSKEIKVTFNYGEEDLEELLKSILLIKLKEYKNQIKQNINSQIDNKISSAAIHQSEECDE
ncbi:MAG: hypothetical protein AB6733_23335 [Clostridiaceae bacterium]